MPCSTSTASSPVPYVLVTHVSSIKGMARAPSLCTYMVVVIAGPPSDSGRQQGPRGARRSWRRRGRLRALADHDLLARLEAREDLGGDAAHHADPHVARLDGAARLHDPDG